MENKKEKYFTAYWSGSPGNHWSVSQGNYFMPYGAMENIGGKKPKLTFKVRFLFSFWFEEVHLDPRGKI